MICSGGSPPVRPWHGCTRPFMTTALDAGMAARGRTYAGGEGLLEAVLAGGGCRTTDDDGIADR